MTRTAVVSFLLCASLGAQQPASMLGSIDVFGLQRVSESSVRSAAGLVAGTPVPAKESNAAIAARLRRIPGVEDARLFYVCCDTTGRAMLFIGIGERGAPRPSFRAAAKGNDRLPAEIVARDSVLQVRLVEAIQAGRSTEADSGGHEFFVDPAVNAIQHEYLAFTRTRVPMLRRVLRTSASTSHRALAASLIGYAPDVRTVIPDLVDASRDPASDVRNNAMRALMVIAAYSQREPALSIRVPYASFIDMLWSIEWTDRNKASAALWQLSAGRDPTLMAELRKRALPPLIDIAQWSDPSHAVAGFILLGRIEGRSDKEMFEAFARGDRTAVLDEARGMVKANR